MDLIKLLILVESITSASAMWSSTLETSLKTELYTTNSYDVSVRPSQRTSINITFGMFSLNDLPVDLGCVIKRQTVTVAAPASVVDVAFFNLRVRTQAMYENIVTQSLEVSGYFQLRWDDPRLDWSTNSTYSTDIPYFFSTNSETWIPGIILMNSVKSLSVWDPDDMQIRVTQSGRVIWNHVGTFVTHCESDVTYYPFDSQSCEIQLTSWSFMTNEIGLNWDTSGDTLNTDFYSENGEWKFLEYSTGYTVVQRGPETYDILSMTLKFKRRPLFQVVNTVLPCLLLAILGCFVFKLPNDSGAKTGFVLTVLLAYTVYLTLVSASMPTTSIHISIFSLYLLTTMVFGIVSVLLTILIYVYHLKSDEKEVTMGTMRLVRMCYCLSGRKCCTSPNKIEVIPHTVNVKEAAENDSKGKEMSDVERSEDKITWKEVAEILNDCFFRVFLISTVVYQLIFISIFIIGFLI